MKVFPALAVLMLIGATTPRVFAASCPPEQAPSDTARSSAAAKAATLPQDVYPDSLNRLPLIQREDLDEAGKKIYDSTVGDSRMLAGLQGPGGIRLYSSRLAEHFRAVNNYLRFETDLGRRLTELAILVTAREEDSQFEWAAHEPAGRKEGLEQTVIDIVKYRKPLTGLGEKEAVIIQLGREVFGKRKVSSDTFARAVKLFGKAGLVNLVSLMGTYSSTSLLLRTFDQQLHPDQKPLLPIP